MPDAQSNPSSTFTQGVLILMRLHFRKMQVLSAVGSPSWEAATWAVMCAVCPGPWVDRDVAG